MRGGIRKRRGGGGGRAFNNVLRGWFNVSGGEKADEDTHRDVFLEISRSLLLLLLKKGKSLV